MKKYLSAAVLSSLLVVGCACPVFAAPKNIYTDADSGFSVQSASPTFEYASSNSYGFQENKSTTDSFNCVAAISADSFAKKTGIAFTTKEFKEKLAAEMNKKSGAKPEYALFRPETYVHAEGQPYNTMEDALLDVFDEDEMRDATFSYETKTVGKQNYFVISMQYPGAFDKEKDIDRNATDKKLYITSENNILYLAESLCSAETESAKKANAAAEGENSSIKKDYEEKGVSIETAGNAVQDPKALRNALLPLTDSSLSDPKFQKALHKEREAMIKGLSFFKPEKKKPFGMDDPVLKQFISLPDNWLFVKAVPEIKDAKGLKANLAWAAPYTMITSIANLATVKDIDKNWKPEDFYNIYDESVLLASYSVQKNKKNTEISDLAEEIFKLPQSDMQKVLDEMLPSLLNNKDLKKYAVLNDTKAKITNNGEIIKFVFDSNVKVMNQFDFVTKAALAGTRNNGLLSVYVTKGDKVKTKAMTNLIDTVKLLPEK